MGSSLGGVSANRQMLRAVGRKRRHIVSEDGVFKALEAHKTANEEDVKFKLPLRIISASFDRVQGLVVERRMA